jgi:hypothetical protein
MKILRFLLSIFFTFFFYLIAVAQNLDSTAYYDSVYDSQNLIGGNDSLLTMQGDTVLKRFSIDVLPGSVKKYTSVKEFRYMRYLDSLLRNTNSLMADTIRLDNVREVTKSKRFKVNMMPNTNSIFNNLFVKIFFWIIAIAFISFIIYKLFMTESFFKRNPRQHTVAVQQDDETIIKASEYEHLINDAITNKNYPLAVRYLYLQTLQKLSSKGLINFSPDKTNYEYVKELSGKAHQNQFASITLNYEYVWYGKFNIDEQIFNRIKKEFTQYHGQI